MKAFATVAISSICILCILVFILFSVILDYDANLQITKSKLEQAQQLCPLQEIPPSGNYDMIFKTTQERSYRITGSELKGYQIWNSHLIPFGTLNDAITELEELERAK